MDCTERFKWRLIPGCGDTLTNLAPFYGECETRQLFEIHISAFDSSTILLKNNSQACGVLCVGR